MLEGGGRVGGDRGGKEVLLDGEEKEIFKVEGVGGVEGDEGYVLMVWVVVGMVVGKEGELGKEMSEGGIGIGVLEGLWREVGDRVWKVLDIVVGGEVVGGVVVREMRDNG